MHGELLAVLEEMQDSTDLEIEELDLQVDLLDRWGDFDGAIAILRSLPPSAAMAPDRRRTLAHLHWSAGDYLTARLLLESLAEDAEGTLALTAEHEARALSQLVRSLEPLRARHRTLGKLYALAWIGILITLVLILRRSRPGG